MSRSVVASVMVLVSPALAGPLAPPAGPVGPTYKTLAEVQPRTAINPTNTPGDSGAVYRITQPGSYYLTGPITGAPSKSGILIAASDVDIDLAGFAVRGVVGAFNGITTQTAQSNIAIRNGTITGWPFSAVSVNASGGGANSVVEDLRCTSNGGQNIVVGANSRVARCAVANAGSYGIYAAAGGGVIESCTVTTAVSFGIIGISNCVVRDCIVSSVPGGSGILVSGGGVVDNCSVSGCGTGIYVESGALATHCTVRSNSGEGFFANAGSSVIACVAAGNGTGTALGAGIHTFGIDNRVEANNLTGNFRGIKGEGTGNLIVRNSASGNSIANWDIGAGNFGLFVNATSGGAFVGAAGGAALGSTDPWVNFSY